MFVAFLRFFLRLSLHYEVFPREDDAPVIVHNLENDVVDFDGEIGARLLQIPLRYKNGGAIRKEPEIAKERLRKCELEGSRKRWIHRAKGAVRREFGRVEGSLKVRSGWQQFLVAHLGVLRQTAHDRSALEL